MVITRKQTCLSLDTNKHLSLDTNVCLCLFITGYCCCAGSGYQSIMERSEGVKESTHCLASAQEGHPTRDEDGDESRARITRVR